MSIEAVMRKYEHQLMQLPNVTGVGIGEKSGKEVIIVFVTQKEKELALRPQGIIPKTLEEYETDVKTKISVGEARSDKTDALEFIPGSLTRALKHKREREQPRHWRN